MNGKLHLALGITSGVVGGLLLMQKPIDAYFFSASCILGSVFPDIDLPNSKLGKYTFGLSRVFNKMFGHRGLFHTPCFLFLSWVLYHLLKKGSISSISFVLMSGFSIGFLCHLIQDMMTKDGIKIFYPFCKKKIHFTNIKSDSKLHYLITLIFMIMVITIAPKLIAYIY